MRCHNCGAELEQGVLFCKECGSKVVQKMFCRECGKELSPGQKFCSYCGADAGFVDKILKSNATNAGHSVRVEMGTAQRAASSGGPKMSGSYSFTPKHQKNKSYIGFTNTKTILAIVAVAIVAVAILGSSMARSRNKKEEETVATLTPTFTASQTDNTIELGTQYAYMSDEWNVYIAEAVSDSVIKIEHWNKTMNTTKKLKYSKDIGSFKLNDEENGFAWVDDDKLAFTFNLNDKGNSRVNGQPVIFTININDADECKGTDYDEKIACYSYQNDDWHNYRAIPLSEKYVKIECWYRGISTASFLFGYDMCVLNVDSNDTDFEWNADKTAFTITIADPANKSYWKDTTFVAFTLENPEYSYSSVLDFLNDNTSAVEEQPGKEPDIAQSTTEELMTEEVNQDATIDTEQEEVVIVEDAPQTQEETKEETQETSSEMPVFGGSSLDAAVNKASSLGVSKQYDEDFGHGTRCMAFSDSSGGLMMDIIYVTATKEIMCATITTNKLASTSDQKAFVKGMASVICPSSDSNDVVSWVDNNVGGNKTTTIGGFTYEVGLGPVDNVLYYAGYNEWEEWELTNY